MLTLAEEEWIIADDERVGVQVDKVCEGVVDLVYGAGLQDLELHPLCTRRILYVSDPGIRLVRVHEQGKYSSLRNQLGKQFEPLRYQFSGEDAGAREVATGLGETGDESVPDRVGADIEDNRDR